MKHLWLLTALLLASCINDEVQEAKRTYLPVRIATVSQTETRAVDGIHNGSFPDGTPVTVAVDGENYAYNANGIASLMTCMSSEQPYFPEDGSSVQVQAYYPAKIGYSEEPQTFIVDSDQSAETGYAASDLMYGHPQADWSGLDEVGLVRPSANPVPLSFDHRMAKVKVELVTNGLNVTSVQLLGIKRAVSFKSSTGWFEGEAYMLTDNEKLEQSTINIFTDAGAGTSPEAITCTALIPPQEIEEGSSLVKVDAINPDRTLTFSLPETVNFVSGSEYCFSLEVGKPLSNLQVTLASGPYTYNARQQCPAIASVTGTLADGTLVTLDEADYIVSYGTNINAGVDAGTVSIRCKGRYIGSATTTFDIAKATPTIKFAASSLSIVKNGTGANKATSSNGLTVSYQSSATGVATISNANTGGVTGKAYGTSTIKASVGANENWNAASASYTLTVRPVKLSEVTKTHHYWLVCTKGWVYPSISDYNTYSGKGSLVAMIAYISSTGHGGAIRLTDNGPNYQASAISYASKLGAVNGEGGSGTWKLPTCNEMRNMFLYCGGTNSSFTQELVIATCGNLRTKLIAHSPSFDMHLGTTGSDYYVLNDNNGTRYTIPGFGYNYQLGHYYVLNYDNSHAYYVRYYLSF